MAPADWVVKYGGNAMRDASLRRATAAALGAMAREGRRIVLVHGGGPAIEEALRAAGVESRFVRGRRVTGDDAIETVETALTLLGKRLAQEVGDAVALTGRDARLLTAERVAPELGNVGRMTGVRGEVLDGLLDLGLVPVVACLACDDGGALLNVNGDEVAGAVAAALQAPVAFLTDVPGVLDDPQDPSSVLPRLTAAEARARIEDGRIAGGMIPKVESALEALTLGAPGAAIADGRSADALPRALLRRAGTRLVPDAGPEQEGTRAQDAGRVDDDTRGVPDAVPDPTAGGGDVR